MYRVPATHQVLALIERTRPRGVPVLFDVDDLIFDPAIADEIPALSILPADEADLWMQGIKRYRTTMEACDGFIGSTTGLCVHAASVTGLPVHRFANGVGQVVGSLSDDARRRPRTPGPPRVGYLSGTDTHDHDWTMIEPAVAAALDGHADAELWLVGLVRPSSSLDRFGDRVRRIGFTEWTRLPKLLRDLDVNLAPLTPGSRFNEAKSAIKWLEAALAGTPTIASPTEPFREAIADGVNGVLVTTEQEWTDAIARLLIDVNERERLGRAPTVTRCCAGPPTVRRTSIATCSRARRSSTGAPTGTTWSRSTSLPSSARSSATSSREGGAHCCRRPCAFSTDASAPSCGARPARPGVSGLSASRGSSGGGLFEPCATTIERRRKAPRFADAPRSAPDHRPSERASLLPPRIRRQERFGCPAEERRKISPQHLVAPVAHDQRSIDFSSTDLACNAGACAEWRWRVTRVAV